ncbi:hypothetical protein B296_00009842 [Ensete ventricosum]|uniref:FAD-binding domain-containing protein n=1 Tax=Ensete ventricosum TaxID=4639 RepID=A0A427AYQ5_ENSVE|nr:hypothetical protein B296_00009842 [Ensete ventricosum]
MEEEQHEVVIVGAGIAGLATAVALKIVGMQTLVLERSPELRAAGAAIGLSSNAWRALDVLGVAHKLLPSCPTVPEYASRLLLFMLFLPTPSWLAYDDRALSLLSQSACHRPPHRINSSGALHPVAEVLVSYHHSA